MNWESINHALTYIRECDCTGCDNCKELSSKILEITQENHREKLEQMIRERILELDDMMQTALMQYNLSRVAYRYGQISDLLKLLKDKTFERSLITTNRVRVFCNTSGDVVYTSAGEPADLRQSLSEGD